MVQLQVQQFKAINNNNKQRKIAVIIIQLLFYNQTNHN